MPIKAGDRLALVYPSANRDEEVFDDPFTFDVTRSPNPHIAFGYGTHFCIGANFARHELELLFAKLTRDWTNLRAVTEPDVELEPLRPGGPLVRARLRRPLISPLDPYSVRIDPDSESIPTELTENPFEQVGTFSAGRGPLQSGHASHHREHDGRQ